MLLCPPILWGRRAATLFENPLYQNLKLSPLVHVLRCCWFVEPYLEGAVPHCLKMQRISWTALAPTLFLSLGHEDDETHHDNLYDDLEVVNDDPCPCHFYHGGDDCEGETCDALQHTLSTYTVTVMRTYTVCMLPLVIMQYMYVLQSD